MSAHMNFTFHYSETEDRLALHASDASGGAVLWITRRLAGRFLEALGTLIAKSNPDALRAPAHAADILAFEHQNAVVGATGGQAFKPQASRLPQDAPVRVVDMINLTAQKNGSARLAFRAGDAQLDLELPRETLHLLYHQVRGLATHAGWNLDLKEPWRAPADPGETGQPRVAH